MNKDEYDKIWLITGISGQDGSWFADYLLELGYKNIHGIIRRNNTIIENIKHIFDKLTLHNGDLTDALNIHNIIDKVKPDYIVNFGAQSHVKVSHDLENYTFQVNTLGILHILQSIKTLGLLKCKVYHASTSEMFGNQTDGNNLLNENSPMNPVSIYGISKLAAQQICNMYKNAYNIFIVSSILFNHEGSRRGKTFVTKKIVDYVCNLKKFGYKQPLQLGNLNARRDWGDAKDYMRAVYLMLINDKPENYVIATGKTYNIRHFCNLAFNKINVNIHWIGSGKDEIGVDDNNNILVQVNPSYYRDIDIECLVGDSTKAKNQLNWEPAVNIEQLVDYMVESGLKN